VNQPLDPSSPAARHDAFLLDLDGVVFRGSTPIPGASAAVSRLRECGPVRFVTNNASRTPDQVAQHLARLGVGAVAAEVSTAAQAAVARLAERVGPGRGRPVLVVGGDGLAAALIGAGFEPVRSATQRPIAVVQGFAVDTTWADLAEAAYALADGVVWIASNLDSTLPTDRGQAPGNGALVAALVTATGRRPESTGKPDAAILGVALAGTNASSPVMVGDRLDTDVAAAAAAGVAAAVVLTGVTRPLDVCRAPDGIRPTYVLDDVSGLLRPYVPADPRPGQVLGVGCGGWQFVREGANVVVGGEGPAIEGVRGLVALAWAAADRHEPLAEPSLAAAVEVVRAAG